MNIEKLRETEYVKCVDLLAELMDLDANAKEIIHKSFQKRGIKSFFLHIDSVELPPEVIEKLKGIKAVIDLSNVKRGQV